jgi:hypothetical protein
MTHPDWSEHDLDELVDCEVTMADHIADGSLTADRGHLEIIEDLEAEIMQRRALSP